jgi:hypothetical protein
MLKFVKEYYENGIIKLSLIFRGKTFVAQFIGGTCPNCLSSQIEQTFVNDSNMPEMAEAADSLDFGDDDEIQGALEILGQYE